MYTLPSIRMYSDVMVFEVLYDVMLASKLYTILVIRCVDENSYGL